MAAKALQTFRRETDLLEFKGGLLGTEALDPEQLLALARLPARDVLYGQLVGVVASPITGLVRTLNALIAGLALQLGQIAEKKESGEIPAGEPPAAMVAAAEARRGGRRRPLRPRLRPRRLRAEASRGGGRGSRRGGGARRRGGGSRRRGGGSRRGGRGSRRGGARRGGARRDRDRGGPGRRARGAGRRRHHSENDDNEADASA